MEKGDWGKWYWVSKMALDKEPKVGDIWDCDIFGLTSRETIVEVRDHPKELAYMVWTDGKG